MAVLLGRQAPVGTTADFNAAGHAAAWTFVASASGQLKVIFSQTKVSNPTATGIELGIYTNVAGVPSARLGFAAVDDLTAARGTGIFQATLATPVTIVSGTTYWLARYMATENCDFQGDASASTYSETTNPSDMVDPWPATSAGGTTTIIWGESVDAASAPVARPMLLALAGFWPRLFRPLFGFPPPASSTTTSTTPVSTSLDLPVEAAQGVARTLDLPSESTQAIAATLLAPVEANQAVAAVASEPVEAVAAAASTAQEPVESGQGVATTAAEPVEANTGLATSAAEPVESLQGGIASSASEPVEALQGVAQTSLDPVEALQGVTSSASDPVEAQGNTPVAQTLALAVEALAAAASALSQPVEALQQVVSSDAGPNLVTPGTFEGGVEGWGGATGAPGSQTLTQDGAQAHSGTSSLKVVTAGTGTGEGASSPISQIIPGVTYTAKVWVFSVAGGEAVLAQICERNAAGVFLTSTDTNVTLAAGWQQITVTRTMNQPTGVKANVKVTTRGAAAAITFWVDDALFREPYPIVTIEALAAALITVSVPVEAAAAIAAAATVLPFETLLAVAMTQQLPIEAVALVAAALLLPFESAISVGGEVPGRVALSARPFATVMLLARAFAKLTLASRAAAAVTDTARPAAKVATTARPAAKVTVGDRPD